MKHSRFWYGYLVFTAIATVIGAFTAATAGMSEDRPFALLAPLVNLVGLIPLYGFVRQRPYRPRWLWIAILFLYIAISVFIALAGGYVSLVRAHPLPFLVALALVLWIVPYCIAVHRYTLRSPHLWSRS
jgi:hypothetical protein